LKIVDALRGNGRGVSVPSRRNSAGSRAVVPVLLTLASLAAAPGALALAGAGDRFPEERPATRAEAAELVVRGAGDPTGCLVPVLQLLDDRKPFRIPHAVRRSLVLLEDAERLAQAERIEAVDGSGLRLILEPGAGERFDDTDLDGNGRPDLLDAVVQGWSEAASLIEQVLGLAVPASTEIVLADLGRFDGYVAPADDAATRSRVLLHVSPAGGAPGARRAALHHTVHAALIDAAPNLPAAWNEAVASWAELVAAPAPDERLALRLSTRARRLDAGLLDDDLSLAPGNALWLAFLDELYGRSAVRVTVEELARGSDVATALDRALGRVSGDDLATALREFHLWTLLVGERDDGRHFSFADRMADARFASTARGLPALSVQADGALAELGASQVLLQPATDEGGMHVRFEGDYAARWEADLLLVDRSGALRRVAIPLGENGSGEVTVPLSGLAEAVLLTRNLGSEDGAPHRYTYAAHLEPDYPFALAALEAVMIDGAGGAVLVSWETSTETDLIGFDLLRERERGGVAVRVNPVWIPAMGDERNATEYHFLDRGAEPGVAYRYRLRGVTRQGLSVPSRAVRALPENR
jgi:hypothetical protein